MPYWVLGWDVFCWLGHRRFARHWSVPQIRAELHDRFAILLSVDAIERYVGRYQLMLAARQQDPRAVASAYQRSRGLILTINGLQPEKGHETLYVVRELTQKRVWFAEALLSSTAAEVQRLLARARAWVERLSLPVRCWISDKQDAFVTGIAAEFAGVPHRYCNNHFLRNLAKPVLEADSHAKVKMRKHVRGLRAIEREVLAERVADTPERAYGGARAGCDRRGSHRHGGECRSRLLCRRPGHPQRQSRGPAAAARGADGRSPDRSAAIPPAQPGGEKGGPRRRT